MGCFLFPRITKGRARRVVPDDPWRIKNRISHRVPFRFHILIAIAIASTPAMTNR
jgi:hypothetical protein